MNSLCSNYLGVKANVNIPSGSIIGAYYDVSVYDSDETMTYVQPISHHVTKCRRRYVEDEETKYAMQGACKNTTVFGRTSIFREGNIETISMALANCGKYINAKAKTLSKPNIEGWNFKKCKSAYWVAILSSRCPVSPILHADHLLC